MEIQPSKGKDPESEPEKSAVTPPETEKAHDTARNIWGLGEIKGKMQQVGSRALGAASWLLPDTSSWLKSSKQEVKGAEEGYREIVSRFRGLLLPHQAEILLKFIANEKVRKLFVEVLELHDKLKSDEVLLSYVEKGVSSGSDLERFKKLVQVEIPQALAEEYENIEWEYYQRAPVESILSLVQAIDFTIAPESSRSVSDFLPLAFGHQKTEAGQLFSNHFSGIEHLIQDGRFSQRPIAERALIQRGFFRASESSTPWWVRVESQVKGQELNHTIALAASSGRAYEGIIRIDLTSLGVLSDRQNAQLSSFLSDFISKESITKAREEFNPADLSAFEDAQHGLILDIASQTFREGVKLTSQLVQSLADTKAQIEGIRSLEAEIGAQRLLVDFEEKVPVPLSPQGREDLFEALKDEKVRQMFSSFIDTYMSDRFQDLVDLHVELSGQIDRALDKDFDELSEDLKRVVFLPTEEEAIDKVFAFAGVDRMSPEVQFLGKYLEIKRIRDKVNAFLDTAAKVRDYNVEAFLKGEEPDRDHPLGLKLAGYLGDLKVLFVERMDIFTENAAEKRALVDQLISRISSFSSMMNTQYITDGIALAAYDESQWDDHFSTGAIMRSIGGIRNPGQPDHESPFENYLLVKKYEYLDQLEMFRKYDFDRKEVDGKLHTTMYLTLALPNGIARKISFTFDFTPYEGLELRECQDLVETASEKFAYSITMEEWEKKNEDKLAAFKRPEDRAHFLAAIKKMDFEIGQKLFFAFASLGTGEMYPGLVDSSFPFQAVDALLRHVEMELLEEDVFDLINLLSDPKLLEAHSEVIKDVEANKEVTGKVKNLFENLNPNRAVSRLYQQIMDSFIQENRNL